jgi:ketosteroid isomerase-like protein
MSEDQIERQALDKVRDLEMARRAAIRENDADTMNSILDEKFVYINHDGVIFDKDRYISAVRSHELTYAGDFDLTESDHIYDGDVVILVGMMLGHARLAGDQQVYHLRNMRVWRARGDGWKLLAWQSSPYFRPAAYEQPTQGSATSR